MISHPGGDPGQPSANMRSGTYVAVSCLIRFVLESAETGRLRPKLSNAVRIQPMKPALKAAVAALVSSTRQNQLKPRGGFEARYRSSTPSQSASVATSLLLLLLAALAKLNQMMSPQVYTALPDIQR